MTKNHTDPTTHTPCDHHKLSNGAAMWQIQMANQARIGDIVEIEHRNGKATTIASATVIRVTKNTLRVLCPIGDEFTLNMPSGIERGKADEEKMHALNPAMAAPYAVAVGFRLRRSFIGQKLARYSGELISLGEGVRITWGESIAAPADKVDGRVVGISKSTVRVAVEGGDVWTFARYSGRSWGSAGDYFTTATPSISGIWYSGDCTPPFPPKGTPEDAPTQDTIDDASASLQPPSQLSAADRSKLDEIIDEIIDTIAGDADDPAPAPTEPTPGELPPMPKMGERVPGALCSCRLPHLCDSCAEVAHDLELDHLAAKEGFEQIDDPAPTEPIVPTWCDGTGACECPDCEPPENSDGQIRTDIDARTHAALTPIFAAASAEHTTGEHEGSTWTLGDCHLCESDGAHWIVVEDAKPDTAPERDVVAMRRLHLGRAGRASALASRLAKQGDAQWDGFPAHGSAVEARELWAEAGRAYGNAHREQELADL